MLCESLTNIFSYPLTKKPFDKCFHQALYWLWKKALHAMKAHIHRAFINIPSNYCYTFNLQKKKLLLLELHYCIIYTYILVYINAFIGKVVCIAICFLALQIHFVSPCSVFSLSLLHKIASFSKCPLDKLPTTTTHRETNVKTSKNSNIHICQVFTLKQKYHLTTECVPVCIDTCVYVGMQVGMYVNWRTHVCAQLPACVFRLQFHFISFHCLWLHTNANTYTYSTYMYTSVL